MSRDILLLHEEKGVSLFISAEQMFVKISTLKIGGVFFVKMRKNREKKPKKFKKNSEKIPEIRN